MSGKIIEYFKQFDFKLIKQSGGCLKFGQRSTLLDAWKSNPLKWGAEITVSISDNSILADFDVDTAAQMNTKEEEMVWQTFVESFQNYLTSGVASNQKLNSTIFESKKSRPSYFSWTIIGALTGGLSSILYNKLTDGNSTLIIFLIPVLAAIFLRWKINYRKTENAL